MIKLGQDASEKRTIPDELKYVAESFARAAAETHGMDAYLQLCEKKGLVQDLATAEVAFMMFGAGVHVAILAIHDAGLLCDCESEAAE